MKRSWIVLAGTVISVGLALMVLTGTAMAQTVAPTPSAPQILACGGWGWGKGGCGQAGLEAAAKALGMTADQLSTQLWGGRTLADLAREKGVDLQTVRDAVDAACKQAVRDAIAQAVTDGRLSQEQANWLLEGLDRGYWGSRGFGFGWRGFGRGFHPRWGVPKVPSTPAPGGIRFFWRPFGIPSSSI